MLSFYRRTFIFICLLLKDECMYFDELLASYSRRLLLRLSNPRPVLSMS